MNIRTAYKLFNNSIHHQAFQDPQTLYSNLHMLDFNGINPLHQSYWCQGQLKDLNVIRVDIEKKSTDAKNIHVAIVMLLVCVGRCWNYSRCYKFGFKIIHFPRTKDPHFTCVYELPQQLQLLLSSKIL